MGNFILIVVSIVSVYGHGTGDMTHPSVTMQEFKTEAACKVAAKTIVLMARGKNIAATCVQAGGA